MVLIRLEGHDFEYQVQDTIKLFYKDEEVVFKNEEPPMGYQGVFILSKIIDDGDGINILTRLEDRKIVQDESMVTPSLQGIDTKDDLGIRKALKREIKRQIFILLSKYTGLEFPWGMLTGIRPAKKVHDMYKRGYAKEKILRELTQYYKLSQNKAQLLLEVAEVESGILKRTAPDRLGIYVGIPFCPSTCLYCSFTSNPIGKYRKMVVLYIEALKREIASIGKIIQNKGMKVQSIYIGGGTPTSLEAPYLNDLLETIQGSFDLNFLEEFSLEAGRPDSINEDKLCTIKQSRVNRISINPQTMNDETLKAIGRNHTVQNTIESFKMARNIGFDNINMDVIVGLPGENLNMFKKTMDGISALGPESLTVHTMAIKRASRLMGEIEKYCLASPEIVDKMVDTARKTAISLGMHPYYLYRQKNMLGNLENVGYSKPGLESVYNVQIMEEKQNILALGAGAVSKVVYPEEDRIERAFNVKSVEEYISRIDEMIERKKALL